VREQIAAGICIVEALGTTTPPIHLVAWLRDGQAHAKSR